MDAPETFNEADIPIATSLEILRSSESQSDAVKGGEVEWKDAATWFEQRLSAARAAQSAIDTRLSLVAVDLTKYSFFAEKYQASRSIGNLFPSWPAIDDINRIDTIFSKYPRALDETIDVYTYHFSSQRIHLVWSYFPLAQTTIAVVINFDELIPNFASSLLDELSTFHQLADHPMLVALCAQKAIMDHLADWIVGETTNTINTQRDTGFHNNVWHVPKSIITPQDYSRLSATVSGNASNFSSIAHNASILSQFADFAHAECGLLTCPTPRPRYGADSGVQHAYSAHLQSYIAQKCYLLARATHLSLAARTLSSEAAVWQSKASIQVAGLFNLIAQRDQILNLTIARDTKKIAEESRRDTTSMKAIAAVTMVFLPGTFVASLFAMPLFNWGHGSVVNGVVDQRIWIYWALTVPLTILTVLGWVVWNKVTMKNVIVVDEEMGTALEQPAQENEDGGGNEEEVLQEKDGMSISKGLQNSNSCIKSSKSSKSKSRLKEAIWGSKSLKES